MGNYLDILYINDCFNIINLLADFLMNKYFVGKYGGSKFESMVRF